MFCPIEDITIATSTCEARCMYNREGVCRHARIKEAQERAQDKEGVREQHAVLSSVVNLDEALKAVSRIKAFVYTDSYVQYALGKGLDELTPDEIRSCMDEQRFARWPRSRPGTYTLVHKVLNILLTSTQS
jgi:hypothetical protein